MSNQFEMVSVASMIPAYQDRRNRGNGGKSLYQGGRLRSTHYYSPPCDFKISYGPADYFVVAEGMTEVLQEFIFNS